MRLKDNKLIDEMADYIAENHGIDVMSKSRIEDVVLSRASLFNACRGLYSSTALGKYFGKNHATILHHNRNHEQLMMLPHYRKLYGELYEIRMRYDDGAKQTHDDLVNRITDLEKQLKMSKTRYNDLFDVLTDIKRTHPDTQSQWWDIYHRHKQIDLAQ